jgi:CTP:molybdopterin cytidylyltransferase MocA
MIDVILLIAGSSKRMGKEKALLAFSKEKSFVCHLLDAYLSLSVSKIYCVLNMHNSNSIRQECEKYKNEIVFIENSNPEKGRLWSIILGINKVKTGKGVFIQNIDNPFVNTKLLKSMLDNYKPNTFVVPQFKGKNGHPLLLGADLIQELKEKSITDLKSFLNSKQKLVYITQNQSVLANINSLEEYQKWFPSTDF